MLLDAASIIHAIVGFAFVFFVPGYIFTFAIYPKREDIENMERVVLGFGLSIVISVYIAFLLAQTIRLTETNLWISLILFTILSYGAYRLRKNKLERIDQNEKD
ncbi:MAG: DUF1616 domain-containing protein [Candidatus Hydrothermarchaeota archaeon]